MRVLGIDPGLTRCGLGIVDGAPGRSLQLVAVSVVRTATDAPLGERLVAIEVEVDRWLEEHRPDAVAVERVFSQHNVRTVMGVAQVSGVVIAAATRRGLPVALHTPSEVKAAVTGHGQGRQGTGWGDGCQAAPVIGGAETGRRSRRAGVGHLSRLAWCRDGSIGCRSSGSSAVISSVHGRVASVSGDSAVIEVGGVGLTVQCTPNDQRRVARGAGGDAGHVPGGSRRLADPLRLRR